MLAKLIDSKIKQPNSLVSLKISFSNISEDEFVEESEFKISAQELHKHKRLLERSESLGRMGYWEYDLNSNQLWASTGARKIYGFENQELTLDDVKKNAFEEFRPMLDKKFEDLILNNEKYDVEFKIFRQKDKGIADVRSLAEYDITERRINGIIQDITQQKEADFELKVAKDKANESDKLKSAFVSNMSHEIRTPMNGIVGFVHLLTETEPDKDEKKEYKEGLHLCCNQLLSRINDILDIAKIESGQITISDREVNINDLLNTILIEFTPIANTKKPQIGLYYKENAINLTIISDKVKLNKILMNLIDNAIRFTQNGHVEFGFENHDNFLEFFVTDTGIGISPDHHEIIFQPFCQADSEISQDYGGTGLGLAIVKTYVLMLGGKIWLKSEPGIGSTFYFTIPKKRTEELLSETGLIKNKILHSGKCLVVDDMEMNYNYLKALMKPLGFNTIWAKNGYEGIEVALSDTSIDLILMDIRMPDIDGYSATKIIKGKRPDLPIIAQSAHALADERKKAMDSGCDYYITKPIYKEELKSVLSTYFENI